MKNEIQKQMLQGTEQVVTIGEFQSVSAQKGRLLAEKIEAAMNEQQLTRQKFAKLMDVQPSIITRWLSGTHNFTVETLFDIEQKLNVKLMNIEAPVYKEMNFRMVVSDLVQSLHPSVIDPISIMAQSNITYYGGANEVPIEHSSEATTFLEFINLRNR